jgi:hypothetical protein
MIEAIFLVCGLLVIGGIVFAAGQKFLELARLDELDSFAVGAGASLGGAALVLIGVGIKFGLLAPASMQVAVLLAFVAVLLAVGAVLPFLCWRLMRDDGPALVTTLSSFALLFLSASITVFFRG